MEEVLDALRRIIARWVKTATPLISDISVGDTVINVRTTKRFKAGDEIIVRGPTTFEKPPKFRVSSVIDNTHLEVNLPLQHNWLVNEGAVIQKLIHGNLVQGLYIGDPENIPRFPAITINAISENSEWLTIDSVKDEFNVEIGIFVEDSTQEEGFRFLLRLTKLVKLALMNNIFPLINDYETTTVTADIVVHDQFIKVADASLFCPGNVILIEDQFRTCEHRVAAVVDETTLELQGGSPLEFQAADSPVVIKVERFIFNSYPKSINYGKISKGTLLKAAVIEWFGWEEIHHPTNGGGWTDTVIK